MNGGNYIGDGLPVFNIGGLDRKQPVLSNPLLGRGVATALDKKGAVILPEHGVVITAASIYNLSDRAFQMRQNAIIERQALALRGPVKWLVDLPGPPVATASASAPPAPAQPAQQLDPPEERAWVYWREKVTVE